MEHTQLKQWMAEQGYSYREVAEQLNLSYEYVYKIATGDRRVTDRFRWRFAEAFGWREAIKVLGKSPEPA